MPRNLELDSPDIPPQSWLTTYLVESTKESYQAEALKLNTETFATIIMGLLPKEKEFFLNFLALHLTAQNPKRKAIPLELSPAHLPSSLLGCNLIARWFHQHALFLRAVELQVEQELRTALIDETSTTATPQAEITHLAPSLGLNPREIEINRCAKDLALAHYKHPHHCADRDQVMTLIIEVAQKRLLQLDNSVAADNKLSSDDE